MSSTASFLAALLGFSLTPAAVAAATPSAGVAQQIRSGLFADVNLGGHFTLGGRNSRDQARPSNAQAYLQLGMGYDLGRNFALAASFGLGSSAASCFAQVNARGDCVLDATAPESEKVLVADNFTATMFTTEATYKHYFTDRLSLQPRMHLGYAILDPEPRRDEVGNPITGGVVVGGGLGVEYATHMDHFSIGVDFYARLISGPNIVSMAFYPKIKYTF